VRTPAAVLAAVLLTALTPLPAGAQAGAPAVESLESLTARAKAAISQSAFESAVKILTEAKTRYPASPQPHVALADLYYDKELYPIALGEYRAAETLGATDFNTLTQISRSYGKLNQEKESIDYLLKILQQYPDSADTVDDLGWMYFKTHQLDKGEQVLVKGIDQLGLQRGLAMTLGTIYSGMNLYDKSRDYYLKSINEAIAARDQEFASIAYYNLSLLEHNFYHYNSALSYTDDSLAAEDRPSGHLARGELFEARMDFAGAEREYMDAYAKDDTPLSKVNLANLYQAFGRLDLARRYGEEVLASKDLAWLLYYGTDTSRHFQDLHELLAAVYDGLAHTESRRPTGAFSTACARCSTPGVTRFSPGITGSFSASTPCRSGCSITKKARWRTRGGSSTAATRATPMSR
jgi:tetratricopeptide (TPR) repeat protein